MKANSVLESEMRHHSLYLLLLMVIFGLVTSLMVALSPRDDQETIGVFFSPRLSQNQIIGLISQTSLKFVSFSASDNIVVVEGKHSDLETPIIQSEIWFLFNPMGLSPCGKITAKPAFKKIRT